MAKAINTAGGGGSKLILLVVVPLLLLGAGGGAAYVGGLLPSGAGAEAAARDENGGGVPPPAEVDPRNMVFVEMPDILVNLQSDARRVRFLKLSLALEVASERDAERIRALQPRILDSFQVHLRSLEIEELQGSAAMYRLKEDLLARINNAVAPVRVRDVLFKEMLVQ
jgi:flagellar protein FliL